MTPTPERLTLFIILDAFRHDFLEKAPYLSSIAQWSGVIRETFGFISTRPAMCAGVYPEETNLAFEYQLRPGGRTFSRALAGALGAAGKVLPNRYLRLGASAWIRATRRDPIARRTAMVGHMPYHQLPLFDLAERKLQTEPGYLAVDTIYDHLRAAGQEIAYFGFARPKTLRETARRIRSLLVRGDLLESDRTMVENFLRLLRHRRPNFAHLHFAACDWVGHRYGPESEESLQAILAVDRMMEKVHRAALERYPEVRMLITADHGMVPVTESYDLDEALRGIDVREPDDFVSFRDSTVARFWFFNPRAEEKLRRRLESLPWGTVFDDEALAHHRIRFPDNANGELFFLLRPGAVLLPNYYQGGGVPPLGMHGYDPHEKDNQGAVLLHGSDQAVALEQGATTDLVDLFPTLFDLHGLKKPEVTAGRSFLAP